jgi:hypothetical protein
MPRASRLRSARRNWRPTARLPPATRQRTYA